MRNNVKKFFHAAIFGLILSVTIFSCKEPYPSHYVVIADTSDSMQEVCESLTGVVKDVLSGKEKIVKDSTLTILATGDASTANEPRQLFSGAIPYSNKVFEGTKKVEKQRVALLMQIQKKCESLAQTNTSPLNLALVRGIELLKFKGCGQTESACYLYFITDSEETADPAISAALKGDKKKATKMPPLLDNAGIKVVFYGFAGTNQLTKPRTGEYVKRAESVWLGRFTKNELVSFSPIAPRVKIQEEENKQSKNEKKGGSK